QADKAEARARLAADAAAAGVSRAAIAKLLAGGTGTTKKLPPVLPLANQAAVQKALGLEETNRLKGARAVIDAARQALAVLDREHAAGKRLVELESKRREMLRDISAAEKTVTAELKKQEDSRIAARERHILGISEGDRTPG